MKEGIVQSLVQIDLVVLNKIFKCQQCYHSLPMEKEMATKALKGHGDFQKKKALSKSLYQIVQSVLTD